ncbi:MULTISPECIES: hypothetical protein [unclassified Streptomyces]|uniref:hypothetical protein n=1 Tax=unclassified Streptomyces TaxID=2593676 RepID=UPI00336A237C
MSRRTRRPYQQQTSHGQSSQLKSVPRRVVALSVALSAVQGRVVGQRAVPQGDDAVGGGGDAFVVGDHDQGLAGGAQLVEEPEDVVGRGAVEVSGGLVGEDDQRLVDQGAGDGDPLPLPAGQLRGQMPGPVGESDLIEEFGGTAAGGAR